MTARPPKARPRTRLPARGFRLLFETHLQQHLYPLRRSSYQSRRDCTEKTSERQLSQTELSLRSLLRCRIGRERRGDLLAEIERPERESEDGGDTDERSSHSSVESIPERSEGAKSVSTGRAERGNTAGREQDVPSKPITSKRLLDDVETSGVGSWKSSL